MAHWSSALVLMASSAVTALVIPAVVPSRACTVRMANPIDDEGNSVQGSERGVSFEEYVAGLGQEATLDAAKQAMLVLKEPEWNLAKMAVSATDEDFEISCSSMDYAEITIEVPPMMNTYEDYFYGLTADSHTSFKIEQDRSDPIEGRMQRRGGDPTAILLKCDPNGQSGEFVANLCFILPEEKGFSKYFQITCKAA
uniref:Uncharacterized protein n=1 Tax=Coccolithus braarudii TaxID=221442 RepID=A0A7S0Q028_9EUKA|mmetsp:Transcript_22050/g.47505  ORF Transcript_22050/g.47505 Transcript_22050/m.47505 type:complete len:197 (+) Transcript_22050:50-640(+)